MKYLIVILLLCVNNYAINANKLLVLPTIVENGLTDDESDLAMASAILQSEKTKDKATLAEVIVKEMDAKFNASEWSVVITTYNQYDGNSVAVRSQNKKLLIFVHEKNQYIITKTSNQTSHEIFTKVLSEAKQAIVQRGYVYDPNNTFADILSFVNASFKQDLNWCSRSSGPGMTYWIDSFGECYRLIADNILDDVTGKFGGRWSVTVGETKSHFQSWSQSLIDTVLPNYYAFVGQFSLGSMHFNILHYK